MLIDAVDNVAADDADADRKKRDDDADGDVPEDDRRPGFPNEMKHRRNVLERAQTV